MEEWHQRMRFWWGDEVSEVRATLAAMHRCGIWYFDAKPGNVMLKDWNPEIGPDDDC